MKNKKEKKYKEKKKYSKYDIEEFVREGIKETPEDYLNKIFKHVFDKFDVDGAEMEIYDDCRAMEEKLTQMLIEQTWRNLEEDRKII